MGVLSNTWFLHSTSNNSPWSFDSHTECVSAGYKEGYNVFIAIDKRIG